MTDGLTFPYLLLLVSGGHCQFLEVRGIDDFRRLGGTIDDAAAQHLKIKWTGAVIKVAVPATDDQANTRKSGLDFVKLTSVNVRVQVIDRQQRFVGGQRQGLGRHQTDDQ